MATLVTNNRDCIWHGMASYYNHVIEVVTNKKLRSEKSIDINKVMGQDDIDYVLKRASYDLKRPLPASQEDYDKVKSNYYVSHAVDVLYVYGEINDKSKINGCANVNVAGDAAWAVQMMAIKCYGMEHIPVYLMSYKDNKTYTLMCDKDLYFWVMYDISNYINLFSY